MQLPIVYMHIVGNKIRLTVAHKFSDMGFRYILIYPQGCDVSNHLSLFLCVANHDKLLPGMFVLGI